jgi:hypothetical protein
LFGFSEALAFRRRRVRFGAFAAVFRDLRRFLRLGATADRLADLRRFTRRLARFVTGLRAALFFLRRVFRAMIAFLVAVVPADRRDFFAARRRRNSASELDRERLRLALYPGKRRFTRMPFRARIEEDERRAPPFFFSARMRFAKAVFFALESALPAWCFRALAESPDMERRALR